MKKINFKMKNTLTRKKTDRKTEFLCRLNRVYPCYNWICERLNACSAVFLIVFQKILIFF